MVWLLGILFRNRNQCKLHHMIILFSCVTIDIDAMDDRRTKVLDSTEILRTKVFNFVIAKISATTEITEFREIRLKFRRNFF